MTNTKDAVLFSRFVLSLLILCHRVLQTARSVQKEGSTEKERVRDKNNSVHAAKEGLLRHYCK